MNASQILGFVSSWLDQQGISSFVQAAFVIFLAVAFVGWLFSRTR